MIESFFDTLEVVTILPNISEVVYGQTSLRSALGYLPLSEFEEALLEQENAAKPRQTL